MSWLTEILKEIPLSEIQRERFQVAGEKHEFEILRLKTERDDFKSKFEVATSKADTLQKQLEAEQKKHELSRKELDEAQAMIQKFTNQPTPPPIIAVRFPGGPISSL
jgi:peptidoglycan hydrolase CwlO-like protein